MANETKNRFPDQAEKKPSTKRATGSTQTQTPRSTRSTGAQSSGAKARPGEAKKNKKLMPTPEERRAHEICGIVLIAVGLFMGLTHLVSTGLLGETIGGFLFGLTGTFNYVLPFVFIGQGIYAIFTSGKYAAIPRLMLLCAVSLCILSFIHVFFIDRITAEGYLPFLWDSFAFGESAKAGGGLLGALFSYPAVQLLGKAGSFVLFPALALISIVALTNLSLQKTSEKVGRVIKQNVTAVSSHVSAYREQRREDRRMEEETRRPMDTDDLDLSGVHRRKKPIEASEQETACPTGKAGRKKSKADELNMFLDEPEFQTRFNTEKTEAREESDAQNQKASAQKENAQLDSSDVPGVRRRFPSSAEKKAKEDAYVRTVLHESEDGRYHAFGAEEADKDNTVPSDIVSPEEIPFVSDVQREEPEESVNSEPVRFQDGEDLFFGENPANRDHAEKVEFDQPDDTQDEEWLQSLAQKDFGDYEKYLPPLGRTAKKQKQTEVRRAGRRI